MSWRHVAGPIELVWLGTWRLVAQGARQCVVRQNVEALGRTRSDEHTNYVRLARLGSEVQRCRVHLVDHVDVGTCSDQELCH